MSAPAVTRALARLSMPNAVLARERAGGFGVFPGNDRRRRPLVRLKASEVRDLASAGVIETVAEDAYVLSAAGHARAARERSAPAEAYAAQHRPIIDRYVIDGEGEMRIARGHDSDGVLRRLSMLRDSGGRAWFERAELAAASRLKSDWERGEIGLVRGSDWSAPPKAGGARSADAQDGAMAARCDAQRRFTDALAALAQPLRCVVERVVLREEGLEALERAESWPARSGKLALKLALAQLAAWYGSG